MRRLTYYIASAVALLALGCGGGAGQNPVAPLTADQPFDEPSASAAPIPALPTLTGSSPSGLGGVALQGDLAQSALALYTITIDPATLAATATLQATRTGTANDDLYLLSIDNFMRADSFQVRAVTSTATTVDLEYVITHPFPAPSTPEGTPNGSTNRADLGIAGQVVFLADVADATGNTFFTDVVANTDLVENADGYTQPRGLLTLTGTANTFPYRQLVDESGPDGSRLGQSNAGDPTGNFGTDGWTRAEFGATRDAWTGYGVLHQGQSSRNTLSLSLAALATAGTFSLDVAVLAKYNDPRGGANATEKKANRLPPVDPDAALFAYRMPHGALDIARLEFLSESGGFFTNMLTASELRFKVTDWDARAVETTETDLALDSDVTKVAIGESGLPALSVSIPGVLGDTTAVATIDPSDVLDDDTAYGGDPGIDSGLPGDEITFASSITKTVTSGQTDGLYRGLVRAIDPEASLDPALSVGLDATSLLPLTANLPAPEVYQAFDVAMTTPNAVPSVTVTGPGGAVASGNGQLTLSVLAFSDGDGDPVNIQFDWNNDGDFLDGGEGMQLLSGTPPLTFNAPMFYINGTSSTSARQVPYQYTDGVILSPITGTINWTLGANQTPTGTASTLPGGTVLSGAAAGTVQLSVTAYGDVEGDAVLLDVDWNNDGDFSDAGESGLSVSGATPVNFPSPLQYNNPTAASQSRTLPYRFRGALNTGSTQNTSFTLGANRAPIVNSGTVSLQTATITEPATFALANSALSVTDPEGDAITFTVRAVPTSGITQTTNGIALGSVQGFTASPTMGPWDAVNSTIAFTVYANDALHATTAGTVVPSSPLVGTVDSAGCGLDMSATNLALATLTTGSVLRAGTGANKVITGVRLTWSDISGEAEYIVQRGNWAPGDPVSSVTFTDLTTLGADTTTYDDTTISAQGTRYLYQIVPVCTVGGLQGTPSQLAMIAMQNFEGAANNTSVLNTTGLDGWLANYSATTMSVQSPSFTITAPSALIGARSLFAAEYGNDGATTPNYLVFSAPELNDRAALGTLTVSEFELVHAHGNGGDQTSAYGVLTNSARPANGDSAVPLDVNNWVWTNVSSGQAYNDNNSVAFTTATGWFPSISTTGNYNWGNSGGAFTETFSRLNATPGTITANHDFVFIAFVSNGNNADENVRVDELAWIVY